MLKRLQPLFFILVLTLPFTLFAQQTFKEGYIVTATDTLHGFLKDDTEGALALGTTFSKDANGASARLYTTADIKAFYFNGGNTFQLVSFTDENNAPQQYFAKFILRGYYNLYSLHISDQQYFVITKSDTSFLLFDDKQRINGEREAKGNYKNILRFLSIGCDNLDNELDRLTFSEKGFINYVMELNRCKEPLGNSTSLYVKAKSKVNIYAYAGALPMGKQYEYAGRIIARFSLPSVSKNTFLNTGIAYQSRTTMENYTSYSYYYASKMMKHTYSVCSAGLTLQNNFTTGIVQPYLEAGLGIGYKKEKVPQVNTMDERQKFGVTLIAAIGVESFITQRLIVKADWRYELIVNYPTIGIAYMFK